jgi:hypothetical protein
MVPASSPVIVGGVPETEPGPDTKQLPSETTEPGELERVPPE